MKGALGAGCPEFKLMGALISSLNPRIREISRTTPGDPTSTAGVRRCVISRRARSPHSKGGGGMAGVPSPTTVEVNAASVTGTPVSKSKATTRDPANEYVRLERNEINHRERKEGRWMRFVIAHPIESKVGVMTITSANSGDETTVQSPLPQRTDRHVWQQGVQRRE